jgi:putative endonuclease
MPKKGIDGENTAAAFLEEKGMRILERNFRHARGEVDIIAMDDQTLVFAEVKTWSVYGIDSLEYAIDKKKQQKIIETAKYFLSTNRKYKYMAIRFDVLFISPKGITQGITHLASAFTEGV